MTDITELAQSLKAAAEKSGVEKWQVKRSGPGEYEVIVKGSLVKRNGWSTYRPVTEGVVDKKTADFIALANPANILALVEALEKAQQQNISDFEIKARLCKESNSLHDRLREAEKRIAELESRTVTVKLPKLKMLEDYLAGVAVEERKEILLGVRMEFHRLLNDAGIKTEVA
ncbi:ead/Ea22-like family protein [Klebsiella aerogenes]|uniref:ead/Ea22-like family protein n=1 Tax=Klebsiella aerogenes TaxID=548 RepID=UPI000699E63B|nr:ead/Ea22-like family protein [Klebsiella aerogenes]MBF9782908.1 ead/Ea22-like family protein [Klebsiella aerogenes]MBF9797494.1 ead/Ea22-like family protein [Klebsiella aerogenes]RSV71154.1 ead/Ea22-like family protein [Klebsiella aerogenes]RSV74585.1 ead/Ea22-like family protein [Klebsiella aerogenes]RSV78773.1 ead/Ea22-like family protein [Klebsiella aerogenes]